MFRTLQFLVLVILLISLSGCISVVKRNRAENQFLISEVTEFDGQDGRLCYVVWDRNVYEVVEEEILEKRAGKIEINCGSDMTEELDSLIDNKNKSPNYLGFIKVGEIVDAV